MSWLKNISAIRKNIEKQILEAMVVYDSTRSGELLKGKVEDVCDEIDLGATGLVFIEEIFIFIFLTKLWKGFGVVMILAWLPGSWMVGFHGVLR